MDLTSLQQQLQQPKLAPVEQWDPPFCGDLPLRIDSQGRWWYQDGEITRPGLIKLFASVLIRQGDDYFLQTPAEKVRIQVEDAPFIAVSSDWQAGPTGPELWLTTNLQDKVPVCADYPLLLQQHGGQQLPYLMLWRGLSARLHRNLYYQLLDQAQLQQDGAGSRAVLYSGGQPYLLASSDELPG
ncbi:DUF1285 domain-containing protein [Alishewanella jeotgali]|uniref:DUF1285 domain-containing protein n=1 Tax=Alishewanella jeotgali KCTC 22429 TaxID=1129374 RepID=H3ZE74_9ALTE|nr:DUF1285 domain-containing protein [Alishewanella jeotgali]EHR41118.1 hypothetical protein AJE_08280 [Alishewanella jeotgali KCTC 22429]